MIYDVNVLGLTHFEIEKHITDINANNIDGKCRTLMWFRLKINPNDHDIQ